MWFALNFSKLPVNSCVVFEDSLIGITGAVASGMKTVLINDTIDRKSSVFKAIVDKIGTRLLCSSIGVNCFLMFFIITYLCAGVTKIAHKSRPLLHTFLFKTRLSVNGKMRIESFIERLSSPEIGFYCWDLFAMNNRQFSHFFFQFITNYILIVKLL